MLRIVNEYYKKNILKNNRDRFFIPSKTRQKLYFYPNKNNFLQIKRIYHLPPRTSVETTVHL